MKIIQAAGNEYQDVFLLEYLAVMCGRLGFQVVRDTDAEEIIEPLLEMMQKIGLDFNIFFRRLSGIKIVSLKSELEWSEAAEWFLDKEEEYSEVGGFEEARGLVGGWLRGVYFKRLLLEEVSDEDRMAAMKKVNPKVRSCETE